MHIKRGKGPLFVILPDGRRLDRGDLPPRDTKRWVARRKLRVVEAVEGGLISAEEACDIWALSKEELDSWRRHARKHGAKGLQTTHLQLYRQPKVESRDKS